MKENILETISFLTCCREVLCDSIDKLDLTGSQKKSGRRFLTKEATDYQILHLIYEGKFPEDKNNKLRETIYIKKSNELINEFEILPKTKVEFIPLCEIGLTSNPIILNFLVETDFWGREGLFKKILTGKTNFSQEDLDKLTATANIGGTALLALLVYLGVKAAKLYSTKAKRACSHLKGKEREDCIKKFRINALKVKIAILQRGKSKCSKTKNPQECKNAIDNKIDKIRLRLRALENK